MFYEPICNIFYNFFPNLYILKVVVSINKNNQNRIKFRLNHILVILFKIENNCGTGMGDFQYKLEIESLELKTLNRFQILAQCFLQLAQILNKFWL